MKTDIKSQIIDELYKPARKNFPRRAVEIRDLREFQTDLADFQKFAKENENHRYIIICINIMSKFLYAEKLLNKKATTVATAMRKILERIKEAPRTVCSDAGKEYKNKEWQALMDEFNILHFTTYSEKKASIAERALKTLKIAIYKNFQYTGSYNWTNHLQRIVNNINNTVHKTTGFKPSEVTQKHEKIILRKLKNKPIIKQKKLEVGTYSRISFYKELFKRAFDINWSPEVFRIVKRLDTNPPVYYINSADNKPIIGAFSYFELQPTKLNEFYLIEKILKRKGNKVLVRWFGLGKDSDEWINASDVI